MENDKKSTGGMLVGATDKNGGGGIKVIAPEGNIVMGGAEIVINEKSAKKYCEELSRINSEDGNGVAIPCEIKDTANTTDSKMEAGDVIKKEVGGKISKADIEEGKKTELEHKATINKIKSNPNISVEKAAELIAKDHLNESPDYYKKLKVMEANMETGGRPGPGGYEYKTVNTRNSEGLKQAEKLKEQGWNIISVGFETIQFERPKKKSLETGGATNENEIATATEIRNQLGHKALYMLGAYDIFADKGALVFKIRGSKKWKHIKIKLNGKDLYDITFTTWRGDKITSETVNDVYAENMHSVIEKQTGLYTSLATGGKVNEGDMVGMLWQLQKEGPYSFNDPINISIAEELVTKGYVEKTDQGYALTRTGERQLMATGGEIVGVGVQLFTKYYDKLVDTIVTIKEEIADQGPSKEAILKDMLLQAQDQLQHLLSYAPNLFHHAQSLNLFDKGGVIVDLEDISSLKEDAQKLSDAEVMELYPVFFEGEKITKDKINSNVRKELAKKVFESVNKLDIMEDVAKEGEIKLEAGGNINHTQTCKCPNMEYHEKLSQEQKNKLGEKHLGIGTTITDLKTGTVSDIVAIEHRGFKLLPQSSLDGFPRQEFFVPFEEIVEKHGKGQIKIGGYENTEPDHRMLILAVKDAIACNILKEQMEKISDMGNTIENLNSQVEDGVIEEVELGPTFAGGGIIGEVKANRKGHIKEIRDVNGKLLKSVHVGDILYNRNSEDKNYRNFKNDLLLKSDALGIHMKYGGVVGVEETPNYYKVDIGSPRKVSTCRTPKWASHVAESVKKGSKVVTCKKYKKWFISSVLVPKDGLTKTEAEHVASEIRDKIEHKKMDKGGVMFESGSTSPKVNNLILFTDSKRNLSEMKENIYSSIENKIFGTGNITIEQVADKFKSFLLKAKNQYIRENGSTKEAKKMATLTPEEDKEFMMICALDFPEWLDDKEDIDIDADTRKKISDIFGREFQGGGYVHSVDYDKIRALKYWGELKTKPRLHFLLDHADYVFGKALQDIPEKELSEYKKLASAHWKSLPKTVQMAIEEHVIMGTYASGGYMATGGFVSKGEKVWNKLTTSKRAEFLHENFTPEITPRSQEVLVDKAYNFLPKNVKIKIEAQYANVEEGQYSSGGSMATGGQIDIWNQTIKIRDHHPDEKVRQQADMLLSQMNTAGGKELMRKEVEYFLQKNKLPSSDSMATGGAVNDTILFDAFQYGIEKVRADEDWDSAFEKWVGKRKLDSKTRQLSFSAMTYGIENVNPDGDWDKAFDEWKKENKIGGSMATGGEVESNKIISELKGERVHNPNMKMTDAQINDMVADVMEEVEGGRSLKTALTEQLKGERKNNPNMKITDAQINDLVSDITSSGGSMAIGGRPGPGGYEYKTVNTRNLEGLKEAEKLKEQGWKIISTGLETIQFERPKKKYMEHGGEIDLNGYTSSNPEIEKYILEDLEKARMGIKVLIESSEDEDEKKELRERLAELN